MINRNVKKMYCKQSPDSDICLSVIVMDILGNMLAKTQYLNEKSRQDQRNTYWGFKIPANPFGRHDLAKLTQNVPS